MEARCRLSRLSEDEAEDFRSFAVVRLLQRSARLEVLFRHRSNLTTYLDSVIANILRDYRIKKWGKWRPSATATQLGTLAMQLEQLVYRDRIPPSEAVRTILQAMGDCSAVREDELWATFAKLPLRVDRRPASSQSIWDSHAEERLTMQPEASQALEDLQRLNDVLVEALLHLSTKQRRVLRLRYADGLSFAEIEAQTGMRTDSLYRMVSRALRRLRQLVAADGVDAASVLAAQSSGVGGLCLDQLFQQAH